MTKIEEAQRNYLKRLEMRKHKSRKKKTIQLRGSTPYMIEDYGKNYKI